MRRLKLMTVVAAVLSAFLLVSACASSGGEGAGGDVPTSQAEPGCGGCESELAAVRAQIEKLPDVRRIQTLDTYGASPTNGATVDLELHANGVGDTGLADEVAAIVWRSELSPVDVVTIAIQDSNGDLVPSLPYDFRDDARQHATYEEQWGPRPVDP